MINTLAFLLALLGLVFPAVAAAQTETINDSTKKH